MHAETGTRRRDFVPIGIAGVPSTDDDKRYLRQATLLLRYRIWLSQPVAETQS